MKKLLAAVLLISCLAMIANPLFADDSSKQASNSSPFRLCFWPGVWHWPKNVNIYGISLGLPVTYNNSDTVAGVDAALGVSMSNKVQGVRFSFLLNNGKDSNGLEGACVNLSKNYGGVSLGIFNQAAEKSEMLQLGLINQSSDSKGVQIGLINLMDNGFLPIFPFINFGFDEKPAK
jgi:hypothetical protein